MGLRTPKRLLGLGGVQMRQLNISRSQRREGVLLKVSHDLSGKAYETPRLLTISGDTRQVCSQVAESNIFPSYLSCQSLVIARSDSLCQLRDVFCHWRRPCGLACLDQSQPGGKDLRHRPNAIDALRSNVRFAS